MLEKMKEIGCYRDTKPNPGQKLPLSQRTGDVIEPMLKPQWWVDSKDMATKAADAVRAPALCCIIARTCQTTLCMQVRAGVMEIKPAIFKDTWYVTRIPRCIFVTFSAGTSG
jgi:valyl-tRNA synthetase